MKKAIRMVWLIMTTYLIWGIIIPMVFVVIVNYMYIKHGWTMQMNTAGKIYLVSYGVVTTIYMRKQVDYLFKWIWRKFRKETA